MKANDDMKKKAVILYSGGLDSTTCLAMAAENGFAPYAISFSYGQRHSYELEVAKAMPGVPVLQNIWWWISICG